ncbi:MAG: hypothetical protein GY861_05490 [bacterium]|nr:hypothetical protein [bacterium]
MAVKKIGRYRFAEDSKELREASKRVLIRVGEESKNWFVLGFRRGGGQTDKSKGGWKKRKHLTIQDASTKKSRGLLVQSGNLRDSIRISKRTASMIVISSNLDYADIHNEGGTIVQTVTAKQRAFFFGMFQKTGDPRWKNYAGARTLTIEIPQREFLGNSVDLERKMERKIANTLEKFI